MNSIIPAVGFIAPAGLAPIAKALAREAPGPNIPRRYPPPNTMFRIAMTRTDAGRSGTVTLLIGTPPERVRGAHRTGPAAHAEITGTPTRLQAVRKPAPRARIWLHDRGEGR